MKLSYQIMPFRTKKKRKEVISMLLIQAAYVKNLNERDKDLLKYRGEKTVNPENSLEEEFEEQLNDPYFKGYKEYVEFYTNPMDVSLGKSLNFSSIEQINWGSKTSYAKDLLGGAQLFIAINLDKLNKKGVVEVLKGTKDDVSPLSVLDNNSSDILRLISDMVKSGSRKKKTKRKKKKSKKKKSKKKKSKKKKSKKKSKKRSKKNKQSGG